MLPARDLGMAIAAVFAVVSVLPASAKENYVREACSVTRHPDLCIQSLSPFSSTAKRSPTKWARAGVAVTITEAKSVARFLGRLKRSGRMRGRDRVAVSDCVEVFEAAIDELHRSLGVLRRLSRRDFEAQIGDLTTWVSAALTDEDTSNALALVNKLAASGFETPPK